MVIDACSVILAGYGAWYLKYHRAGVPWSQSGVILLLSILFVMGLNNYFMGRFGLYGDSRPKSLISMSWAVIKSVSVVFVFLSAVGFIFRDVDYSREFALFFGLLSALFLIISRSIVRFYLEWQARKGFHAQRILVVGDMNRGKTVSEALGRQLSWGHEILEHVILDGQQIRQSDLCAHMDQLPQILRTNTVDEVIFALDGDRSFDFSKYLDICRQMGITARILPALWQAARSTIEMETCQGIPFLTLRSTNFNATGLLYKRLMDIIGGAIGTLLFLFIYPMVAAAIKLDSPGPVLFKQKRMGQHGRVFHLLKFRTMCVDAEARKKNLIQQNQMNGAMFKLDNDPRITRVGKFLRKTSLDEFPQFLNVLHGQMSLVGTRPPTLDEVALYQPQHLKRISAKPGITGMWQVSGRNKITDFDEVVRLDCKYMDGWKFSDDLRILIKTVFIVLKRKGAV